MVTKRYVVRANGSSGPYVGSTGTPGGISRVVNKARRDGNTGPLVVIDSRTKETFEVPEGMSVSIPRR